MIRVLGAVLSALALTFTFQSWRGLSEISASYLYPLFWLTVAVVGGGALARTLRFPSLAVVALQIMGVGLYLNHRWAEGLSTYGWIPSVESLQASAAVVGVAAEASTAFPAPVPNDVPEFAPLMILAGVIVVLAVDLLANGVRRVPLAGLPLLAAFTAPVQIIGGTGWLPFVGAAFCFVLMMVTEQAHRMSGWGNVTSPGVDDNQPHSVKLSALWPSGVRIGGAAVVLALAAPALLPNGLNLLDPASGPGALGGSDEVRLVNPILNLKRDLERARDVPLITMFTDDPDPAYLRLTVLENFDGSTWSPGERAIPVTNDADGLLPNAPGLSVSTRANAFTYELASTAEFFSSWLPTPYPATEIDVSGNWRYDSDTLDIVAVEGSFESAVVRSLDVTPEAETLVSAVPAPPGIRTPGIALPRSTPESVRRLAREVTANAESDFARAVALQDWFRRDGGFEYSLEPEEGTGLEQIELFLSEDPGGRVGYCEQFASAMALMARSLGIPARLAVGFLRPQQAPNGNWIYSSYDLHAWPELYFSGAGWVSFEPTPAVRTDGAPAYTNGALPAPADLQDPQQPTPDQRRLDDQVPTPQDADVAGDEPAAAGSSGGRTVVVLAGVLLVVATVAITPRLLRRRARRIRRSGRPQEALEGGWGELEAVCVDLGRPWDSGATLREQARSLLEAGGNGLSDPGTRTGLDQLVRQLERVRYSAGGSDHWSVSTASADSAWALVAQITKVLTDMAPVSQQRRARWLAPSLLSQRGLALRSSGSSGIGREDQQYHEAPELSSR